MEFNTLDIETIKTNWKSSNTVSKLIAYLFKNEKDKNNKEKNDETISNILDIIKKTEYCDIEHFKEDYNETQYETYIKNHKIITVWISKMLYKLQNRFSEQEKQTFSSLSEEIEQKKEITTTQMIVFIEFICRHIFQNWNKFFVNQDDLIDTLLGEATDNSQSKNFLKKIINEYNN